MSPDARLTGLLMLVVAAMAVALGALMVAQNAVTGPWNDEYATLWFSDPAIGLGRLYAERLSGETNPPLYYLLIRAARGVLGDDIGTLRLTNLGFFALAVFYPLLRAWKDATLRPFALCLLAIWLSNGDPVHAFPLLRSYFLQVAAGLVFGFAVAVLLGARDRIRGVDFVALALAALVLMNAHFVAALACGAVLAAATLFLLLVRRRRDAMFTGAVLLAAAAPEAWFVLAHAATLAQRAQGFWIDTTTTQAARAMAGVVRGALSKNLALLGLLLAATVWLRGEGWRAPAAIGLGILAFFAALLGLNAVRPLVVTHYLLVATAPLMAAACLLVAPLVRRHRLLLVPVLANAVMVLAWPPYAVAEPNDDGPARAIAQLRGACPTTRVHGLWRDAEMSGIFRIAYRSLGERFLLPIEPHLADAPWTPPADPACPTVLWCEHLPTILNVRSAQDFAAFFQLVVPPGVLARAQFRRFPGAQNVVLVLPTPPT